MLDLSVSATARQDVALSPRLQQAVRLLQMSSLDYRAEIERLSAVNPFLEEDDDVPSVLDAQRMDAPPPDLRGERRLGLDGEDGSSMEWIAAVADFRSTLREALAYGRATPRERQIAAAVIDSLDDDGYLRLDDAEFLAICPCRPACTRDDMQRAVELVRTVGPAGIAARDLRECLALQVDESVPEPLRELVHRLIAAHLPAVAANRARSLAKPLGVDDATLREGVAALKRLTPKPAHDIDPGTHRYIVPDVLSRRVRGLWTPVLNPALRPAVRLNTTYVELFQRARDRGDGAMTEQLRSAQWMVKHIDMRLRTILEVATSIVERQRAFFDDGPIALKPLGLSEVARDVGVHESTVSRATSGKYLATPHGTLELKYFFSRAMAAPESEAAFSGKAIRGLIGEIIATERQSRPLSDVAICDLLSRQGLKVARRTVTKYRQSLGIRPFEQRVP